MYIEKSEIRIKINLLFKITTVVIVTQKNTPGQLAESIIANATVIMNTITSMMMPQTMRGVRSPLRRKNKQIIKKKIQT